MARNTKNVILDTLKMVEESIEKIKVDIEAHYVTEETLDERDNIELKMQFLESEIFEMMDQPKRKEARISLYH